MAERTIDEAFDQAARDVRGYGIGFVRFPENMTTVELAGSGTLVRIRGNRAILTAAHVIESLPIAGPVGLLAPGFPEEGKVFCPKVEMSFCKSIRIPRGLDHCDGPDLAALILPNPPASDIEARKSFFNIDHHRKKVLANPPSLASDTWLLCGSASDWTREEIVDGQRRSYLRWECGRSLLQDYEERGRFDYVAIPTLVDEETDTPESFEGFSGAGLWHVGITESEDGFEATQMLVGVSFYQSARVGASRIVRCHCIKSIYENLYEAVVGAG